MSWLVEARAKDRPNAPFLVWEPFDQPSEVWAYGQLARAVARVAGGFVKKGIGKGDHVLIHLDNCPEYLLAVFACARLGAVAVCTNTRSSQDELEYYADHSGANWAVTQESYLSSVLSSMTGAKGIFLVGKGENAAAAKGGYDEQSAEILSSFNCLLQSPEAPEAAVADQDPMIILYTSGTTGRPKGVIWTHANFLWGAKVSAAHEGLTAVDVQLAFLPLFHVNALSYAVGATLHAGGTCVLQPRFSASRYWDVSIRNRCTFCSHVYFTLRALSNIEAPKQHFYRLWGTGICDHPIATSLGIPTIGWWGMTETISHPIISDHDVPNNPQTIGRAATEYSISILDDDGETVSLGETGHLVVRGVPGLSLFAGYLHDEQATTEAFDAKGWFMSGDRVTLRADGSIVFADRSKDMLRVGSENVAASEIERVIIGVPGVIEVAVVGMPDPMLDEVPVAFITTKVGTKGIEEAILVTCRKKLASFKVPRTVHVIADMPRANLGKVAKHKLREILKSEEGLKQFAGADAQI